MFQSIGRKSMHYIERSDGIATPILTQSQDLELT